TDTDTISSRAHRHAASASDPGGGRDAAGNKMLTTQLQPSSVGREGAFERVDDNAELFGIYALIRSLKLTHRDLEFGEGIRHEESIPNIRSRVKSLFTEIKSDLGLRDHFRLSLFQATRPTQTPPSQPYPNRAAFAERRFR